VLNELRARRRGAESHRKIRGNKLSAVEIEEAISALTEQPYKAVVMGGGRQ
jgi:hypothetical protein